MRRVNQGIMILLIPFIMLTAGCSRQETGEPSAAVEQSLERVTNRGVAVHDPSLIKSEDGRYYLFGTHMAAASSSDLVHWKMFAQNVGGRNPLFNNLFTDMKAFEYVGRNSENWYSVWAPQVIYNKKTGQYMMYFCTTSSYIKSSLCFAVSDTIEGPYSFVDRIIDSGFTPSTIKYSNISDIIPEDDYSRYFLLRGYNNQHWPNAIDPALFYDEDDRLWMTYGSWSGGIFLLEIDEETGYPIHPEADEDVDTYFGRRLIGGFHHSVEGPWIHYDEESGWYYLFVTYGSLQRDGGYQIRLFRSENVEGPYVDPAGQTLGGEENHHDFGMKMTSNYTLPSLDTAYMAPGHNSVFQDVDVLLTAFHTRFNKGGENHEPRIHQLLRLSDGWLTMAPYRYSGTAARTEGITRKELRGDYLLIDHGIEISSRINTPVEVKLAFGGRVRSSEKSLKGKWSYDEKSGEIEMILGGRSFRGIVLEQEDELGRPVVCISAVSPSNHTVWAVRTP
ncbi:MAG: glycoside hydrolase family 43 protein [Spirochaetales bacterium]|nr:glycoside hydrolase family 43 protein [Spirochaetales bacterium]